jgi:hypothetical protein
MNRTRASRSVTVSATLAVVLVSLVMLAASGVLGATPTPSSSLPPRASAPPTAPSSPSNPPSSPPVGQPPVDKPPVDKPPVGPNDDAADGVDVVELINWPGVDSSVVVWDETDTLADASSGRPDRHGRVAYDVVEAGGSVDGSTIRLTWSDLPIATRAQLSIRIDADGTYRLTLFRPRPAESDGVVSDRVLDLKFNVAVPAEDVDVQVVESLAPSAGVGLVQAGLTTSGGTGLSIAVWDETDGLAGATIDSVEGDAAVGPATVLVANDDEDTLRVTWADPEAATYAKLSIRMGEDGRYRLRIVREHPPAPTVAALNREVLLDFHVAVPADDVDVQVLDAVANEG